jgi:hypothetical protein
VARPARARPPRRPDGPAGVACVTGACPGASPLIGCATLPEGHLRSEMRGYPTIVKVTTFVSLIYNGLDLTLITSRPRARAALPGTAVASWAPRPAVSGWGLVPRTRYPFARTVPPCPRRASCRTRLGTAATPTGCTRTHRRACSPRTWPTRLGTRQRPTRSLISWRVVPGVQSPRAGAPFLELKYTMCCGPRFTWCRRPTKRRAGRSWPCVH